MDAKKTIKAGKIAQEVRAYAQEIVVLGAPLLEIAEKIEQKIRDLGGEPAFPTNLSINEIAAHDTPLPEDDRVAHGLIKVDFGVHIDGWIADTALSIDLEGNLEHKKLIETAEHALNNALKIIQNGIDTNEIGKEIQRTTTSFGLTPIANLTGHSLDQYDLHAGMSIPNITGGKSQKIIPGLYAIEPFVTRGIGTVRDGKPSGIYLLENNRNVRSSTAREVLTYITEEYGSLPFCARWIIAKFGKSGMLGLRELERNGNLYEFAQLIESSGAKVAQAEHSVLIEKDKVVVTTRA